MPNDQGTDPSDPAADAARKKLAREQRLTDDELNKRKTLADTFINQGINSRVALDEESASVERALEEDADKKLTKAARLLKGKIRKRKRVEDFKPERVPSMLKTKDEKDPLLFSSAARSKIVSNKAALDDSELARVSRKPASPSPFNLPKS